jgi:hypothetical protein
MPNEFKVKNGLLVSGSANVNSSGSSVFTVDGTSGRLFSVDDSLSGSLFSVNTAAGLPIIEAFSDNTVRIGQFGRRALFVSQSRVGVGKETGLNGLLDVSGSVTVTGSAIISGSLAVTGSLAASSTITANIISASGFNVSIATGFNARLGINESSTFFGENAFSNFGGAIGESTAIGWNALSGSTTGFWNTAIGSRALINLTTGTGNVAVGRATLSSSRAGSGNVAFGNSALSNVITGSDNIAIGSFSGAGFLAGDLTFSSRSVFIGYAAYASQSSSTNEIVIGADATGFGSNTATLGNTNITRTILRGAVSASGGITGSLLGTASFATSASWAPAGGGIPGGTNTAIQFNDAGAFSGSGNFTFTKATNTVQIQGSGSTLLRVTGSAGDLLRIIDSGSSFPILAVFSSGSRNVLTVTTSSIIVTGSAYIEQGFLLLDDIADPAAPTGSLAVYAKNIGGRVLPKWIGPSGVDVPFQPNIAFNNLSYIVPGGGATIDTFGCTVTTVGTVTNPALSSTNLKTQTRRFALTSGTTAGNSGSVRVSNLECWRGNAAGLGGFYVTTRFGFSGSLQTGMRSFVGLMDTTGSLALINPITDTTLAKVGIAITASNNNWHIINNTAGTTPTAASLGAGFPADTTTLYELILHCRPSGSAIDYRVTNLSSSLQASGSLTTNLPAATTFLGRYGWVTNNATAAAVALEISKLTLETDY